MKRAYSIGILVLILFLILGFCTYLFLVPTEKYDASFFHIIEYKSSVDYDEDGVDDQTDFLNGVKEYIKTKPKYKSNYYATGYPSDEYGVCTDVVANGFLSAGYDIMELMNEDILENQDAYAIDTIDKNIDFRRVKNLNIYLSRKAISLTTDLSDIASWQGGDIVVFKNHIGVLSDARNKKGIPYLIHHANPYQLHYEEDVLEDYEILAHYRIR